MAKNDHVAFQVSKMDVSIQFYTEGLGLRLLFRNLDEKQQEDYAFLELDGGKLELIQLLDIPFSVPKIKPPYCPHLALTTDDMDKTLQLVKERGISIVEGPLEIPGEERWVYISDPDNNIIEYIQSLVHWTVLPGGITDLPVAATTFNDKLYLFAISSDRQLSVISTADGASWGRAPVSDVPFIDGPLAATVFNDKLYLFAKNLDGTLWTSASADGANWSEAGWVYVGHCPNTFGPIAATAFNDKLYLFARNLDGTLWTNASTDGANWNSGNWALVALTPFMMTGVPVVATAFNGKLYLFCINSDGLIWVNATADGASWGGWAAVSVGTLTDVPVAATAFNDRLYLFAKSISDRRIHMSSTADGTNWTSAREAPGEGLTESALVASGLKRSLYLFTRGLDGRIWVISGIR